MIECLIFVIPHFLHFSQLMSTNPTSPLNILLHSFSFNLSVSGRYMSVTEIEWPISCACTHAMYRFSGCFMQRACEDWSMVGNLLKECSHMKTLM